MIESDFIASKLNQIDKLKARGVGDHISLPQLVVCGDQSAGKSSVLEGITEIPFPRQDGLCTRFATEIILRHSPDEQSITASIIPHASRDQATAERLRNYRRHLGSYEDLPDVIQESGRLMGLRGFTDEEFAPPFTSDVLRIEVIGPIGLHLTIVDLPGLVSGADNDEKVLVENLVDSYLQNSRTIILAVIPAVSDVETQPIIRDARLFDEEGVRTVGIITKADLINQGTENRVAAVMKNQGPIQLKLGYFLLKNPSPMELEAGITIDERRENELRFFEKPVWKNQKLNRNTVGIESLRRFLQTLLERHIEREMPKVRSEIEELLSNAQEELDLLGHGRPDPISRRLYLSRLGEAFSTLTKASVDGAYQGANSDFFAVAENGFPLNRVRAHVHALNGNFAKFMGHKSREKEISVGCEEEESDGEKAESSSGTAGFNCGYPVEWGQPKKVSREEFDKWVLEIYTNTKGLELPGNYGHTLLMELFQAQSNRWYVISKSHTMRVHDTVCGFANRALARVVPEDRARDELRRKIRTALRANLTAALAELNSIWSDEKIQPITYNRYYTDTVQKARESTMQDAVGDAFNSMARANWADINCAESLIVEGTEEILTSLVKSLQDHLVIDRNIEVCNDAKTALEAYYQVSQKTFVDNVCRQVIERHLVAKLPTIFHPTSVIELSDQEVERIAGEPKSKVDNRARLVELTQTLEESLDDLQN